MNLNPTKCKLITLGLTKGKSSYDYNLAEHTLHESICEGNLGVNTMPSILSAHHTEKSSYGGKVSVG